MKNSIQIHGLSDSISSCEAFGLSLCFDAYADHSAGEDIMQIGFNSSSGYVYIALENGIQICSCLGRDVQYIVSDFETGEDYFFESYHEAEEKLFANN